MLGRFHDAPAWPAPILCDDSLAAQAVDGNVHGVARGAGQGVAFIRLNIGRRRVGDRFCPAALNFVHGNPQAERGGLLSGARRNSYTLPQADQSWFEAEGQKPRDMRRSVPALRLSALS
jgi:hypothetical protein